MYNTTTRIISEYANNNDLDKESLLGQFKTYSNEAGWEDWMNDYTDAEEGEECTERELEDIENAQAERWITSLDN